LLWRELPRHKYSVKEQRRIEKSILRLTKKRPLAIESVARKIKANVPLHDIIEQDYEGTKKEFFVTPVLLVSVCLISWYITKNHFFGVIAFMISTFVFRQGYVSAKRWQRVKEED
jgi:hypothetical protein